MEFAKKRRLKSDKNEVAKKKKVGSTKGECNRVYLPDLAKKRLANNKNEVAKKQKVGGTRLRESYLKLQQFFAKMDKGRQLAENRRSKNNKNKVAKKQKVRSTEAEPHMMLEKPKGLKISKNRNWRPEPHLCRNLRQKKKDLEAVIGCDLAT